MQKYDIRITENSIIKYIKFFKEMSESILSKEIISKGNLADLSKELNSFKKLIHCQINLDNEFKEKIASIDFDYTDESSENPFKEFP